MENTRKFLREFLFALIPGLLIVVGIRYFWGGPSADQPEAGELRSGQHFLAPRATEVHRPLAKEIDFFDAPADRALESHTVETPLMRLVFTNDGGMMQQITFKRIHGDIEQSFTTLDVPVDERTRGAFLIGLTEKTPWHYRFMGQREDEYAIYVTYAGANDRLRIIKEYAVAKKLYKVDLSVKVEPLGGPMAGRLRLFVPAPFCGTCDDVVQGIMNTEKGALSKHARNQDLAERYWVTPTLFGAEDRYFVHSLYKDDDNFVRRGYFLLVDDNRLTAVFEGPEIKQAQQWHMSFYLGPKEAEAMALVDERLEGTLDYGIFKPLSTLMLKLLKWLYQYVHNYGFAVIILTVLIKILSLPLTWRSDKENERRQAEGRRKMQYIEQKYKHDQEALMREKAEIGRKYILPGVGGCLVPLLIQVPVFLALSRVLSTTIELYRAPFIGWITDLSARDPYYVLPILFSVGMILQMASTGDVRQRLHNILLAIVFSALFANFSAGLVLYSAVSVWLGLGQSYMQRWLSA